MYIFGGILELTHELNDLVTFDFETKKFSSNSETAHDEANGLSATAGNANEHSPTATKKDSMSPMKRKAMVGSQSPARSPMKKRNASPQRTKKDENEGGNRDGLSSPTSVSMQNSFIIKNADESFETNSKLIPKLKHHKTMIAHETPKNTSFVEGNRPTPRDGHSAVVDSLGFMYVFGGDRHHMPFNDLYMIRLE